MGGMHGLGPIAPEADEPVFHAEWEARVLALNLAANLGWNIDTGRHQIEQIPPADYLRMTYYEKWLRRLEELLVIHGGVTPEELASGRPDPAQPRRTPRLSPEMVGPVLRAGGPSSRDIADPPAFEVGDRVRARQIQPLGHTRLPRFVRGRTGVIARRHGAHVFPDANAHGQGEQPRHLYNVGFQAAELWGEETGRQDQVFLDLWEPYLERA